MAKDFDQISSLLQQAHKDAQEKGGYKPSADAIESIGLAPGDPVLEFKRRMMVSAVIRRRIKKFQRETRRILKPHQWALLISGVISFLSISTLIVVHLSKTSQYKRYIKAGKKAIYNDDKKTLLNISGEIRKSMPDSLYKMYMIFGETYNNLHKYDEARLQYRYALVSNPELIEPYLYFASYYYRKNDYKNSLAELNHILGKIPNYVEALRLRGRIYLKEYKLSSAEKDFSSIVKIFPSDFSAHFYLKKIYLQNGEFNKVQREQKFLLQADVENVTDIEALIGVANSLLAENYIKEAKSIVEQSFRVDKNSAAAHFSNSRLKLAEDNVPEAFREINLALKYSNDFYPEAHNLKGEILYYKKGQVDQAIEEFKKAIHQNPYYPDSHFNLANVLFYELYDTPGIWKTILKEYLLAQKNGFLYTDDPEFLYNVGVCYYNTGRYEKSLETWSKLIKYRPQNPDLYYVLGNAHFLSGNLDSAIDNYKEALRHDVNFYKVLNNLSVALELKGEKKKSLENFWMLVQNKKLSPAVRRIANKNLKRILKGTVPAPVSSSLVLKLPRWI